jgi:hypothetical protein
MYKGWNSPVPTDKQVVFELVVLIAMIAFDAGLLDSAVHPFDLAVGPGVLDPGEPVIRVIFVAADVEHVGHVNGRLAMRQEGELDAVVGEHGVDL